jgi:hypothetical protein
MVNERKGTHLRYAFQKHRHGYQHILPCVVVASSKCLVWFGSVIGCTRSWCPPCHPPTLQRKRSSSLAITNLERYLYIFLLSGASSSQYLWFAEQNINGQTTETVGQLCWDFWSTMPLQDRVPGRNECTTELQDRSAGLLRLMDAPLPPKDRFPGFNRHYRTLGKVCSN